MCKRSNGFLMVAVLAYAGLASVCIGADSACGTLLGGSGYDFLRDVLTCTVYGSPCDSGIGNLGPYVSASVETIPGGVDANKITNAEELAKALRATK